MKAHPFKKFSVSVAAIAAIAAISSGCKPAHGGQEQKAPPPPVITVAPVGEQELVEWEEFTGRTAAIENVEVRPRVSGHIEAVKFQAGQLVKKGDVLFQIDSRWHKADFDRRSAEYEAAKVRLASAEREAKRSGQLIANNAISTEESEQREARFQEAKAAVLGAEAAMNSAKLDLENTQIRSPINGRVSRALVTEGNYVSGTAGMTTLLTTIVSVDPVHVYADVDENSLLKFNAVARDGKIANNGDGKVPVEMQLGDDESFTHKGSIESFDNKVDPNTGSILLRSVFANPDGRIVPGLFARIRIPVSEKHSTVLIDESAVGTDQAKKFVLTLTETNTVQYRPVVLGPLVNGKRVVRSGLRPGEQIVVNGLQRVRPGMPVQPQKETAPAANGAETAKSNETEGAPKL